MISSDRDWLDSLSKSERVRYFYLPALPLYVFLIPLGLLYLWSADVGLKLWNLLSHIFHPYIFNNVSQSAGVSSKALVYSNLYWLLFYVLYLAITWKLPTKRALWGCLFMMGLSIGLIHVVMDRLGYTANSALPWW